MNKEFVTYEQAKALKELGFDEMCFGFYSNPKVELMHCRNREPWMGNAVVAAPLRQQVFKFFRENHNWQHSIEATSDQHSFDLGYNYWIWNNKTGEEYHTMPKNRPTGDWEYETYEEAESACIDKLIEIAKQQDNG